MRRRYLLWWGSRAAVAVAAVVLAATWQADGPASPSAVFAGTWEGDWSASTGHWVGTVTWQFDDSGEKKWTEAEKKVVREAAKEWEDLPDSSLDLEEVTEGADLNLNWQHGGGVAAAIAAIMTYPGLETGQPIAGNAPSGAAFNIDAHGGWYVDPDPTTDEPIPDVKLDLLTVAKHELGHTLGLKHTYGTRDVMVLSGAGEGARQHPSEGDQKAAANLYPAPAPTPEPMDEPEEATLNVEDLNEIFDEALAAVNSDPSLFGLEGYSLNSGRTGDLTDEAYTNFSFIPLDLTAGSGRVAGQVLEYNNPRVAAYQKRFLGAAFTDRESAQEWINLARDIDRNVGATNGDGETLDGITSFDVDIGDASAGMVLTLHSGTAPQYHSVWVGFIEELVFGSVEFYITEEPGEDVQQQAAETASIMGRIIGEAFAPP